MPSLYAKRDERVALVRQEVKEKRHLMMFDFIMAPVLLLVGSGMAAYDIAMSAGQRISSFGLFGTFLVLVSFAVLKMGFDVRATIRNLRRQLGDQ